MEMQYKKQKTTIRSTKTQFKFKYGHCVYSNAMAVQWY